jgi:3-hydroxyacyl-CoA dehydrogenase
MFGRVAVVGGGEKAAALSLRVAQVGVPVVAVAVARARVAKLLDEAAAPEEVRERIRFTSDLAEIQKCDLVVESGPEDFEARRDLLARIEASATPNTILATTDEKTPLAEIASHVRRPTQLVGLYVRAGVIDIVTTEQTAPGVVRGIQIFADRLQTPAVTVGAPRSGSRSR